MAVAKGEKKPKAFPIGCRVRVYSGNPEQPVLGVGTVKAFGESDPHGARLVDVGGAEFAEFPVSRLYELPQKKVEA